MLLGLVVTLAVFRSANAYDITDPSADHAAVAIDLAEEGDMDGAVASFRAAAKFGPGVAENWFNLGTALEDPDFEGQTATTAREAKQAMDRYAQLADGGGDGADGNVGDDALQGGGYMPGRGWGVDWSIDITDRQKLPE